MEFSNEGNSVYHNLCCIYTRSEEGNIINSSGPAQRQVLDVWPQLSSQLVYNASSPSLTSVENTMWSSSALHECQRSTFRPDSGKSFTWVIHETKRLREDFFIGIIHQGSDAIDDPAAGFDTFFSSLLLRNIAIFSRREEVPDAESKARLQQIADAIVALFDTRLRYIGMDDRWDSQGKSFFMERVLNFVRRDEKLELCLPAFPCKSSNPHKVGARGPDRGEQLALENLHEFVQSVEEIYQPGATLWIISDGHVFSDCIGIDDQEVDTYGAQLIEMNAAIEKRSGFKNRIQFKSLVDLFDLKWTMAEYKHLADDLKLPEVEHHIATGMTDEAELSRRILMRGCQPNRGALRAKIVSDDPSILRLYRGFSRFMLEDLEFNQYTAQLSRSQRKRLSSKVALEMIMRNQAYSNLVEMIFPFLVRLSIHAHPNCGPKFGIKLFDASVKVTDVLVPDGAPTVSTDLLHVPTPWHNTVVDIPSQSAVYMTKSKVARDALSRGDFTGSWITDQPGKAPFFLLTVGKTESEADAGLAKIETKVIVSRNWRVSGAVYNIFSSIKGLYFKFTRVFLRRAFPRWLS